MSPNLFASVYLGIVTNIIKKKLISFAENQLIFQLNVILSFSDSITTFFLFCLMNNWSKLSMYRAKSIFSWCEFKTVIKQQRRS